MSAEGFYGIYRGVCVTNADPEQRLRIKAQVPQLLGEESTDWAWPCFDPGHAVPPKPGDIVWVSFEGGDITHPLWMGSQKPGPGYVSRAGDTMTGPLTLQASSSSSHATTRGYVDSAVAGVASSSASSGHTHNYTSPAYVDAGDAAERTNANTKVAKTGDTMSGHLTLPTGPGAAQAVRKDYVDTAVGTATTTANDKVAKAGDTMTGLLTLSGAPTAAAHAATKTYVDTADATKVTKGGDTMTGLLTLSGAPTANLHAATKAYVDSTSSSAVSGAAGSYVSTAGGSTITTSAAGVRALLMKGTAGQTADYLRIEPSGSTNPVATISSDGTYNMYEGTAQARLGTSGGVYGMATLYRNSVPAASDIVGRLLFTGQDSAGTATSYADIRGVVADPLDGAEQGYIRLISAFNGVLTENARIGQTGGTSVGQMYVPSVDPASRVLTVRAAAAQTANIAEFQNSGGDMVSGIGPDGRGIGALADWELIETLTLTAVPMATIGNCRFSNIPTKYTKLRIESSWMSHSGTAGHDLYMRLNGDATANYGSWMAYHSTAAETATTSAAVANGHVFYNYFYGGANRMSTFEMEILTPVGKPTTWRSEGECHINATAAPYGSRCRGIWNNTAAVTQIDLYTPQVANWDPGSVLRLYGKVV